jgi:hypothetical protein
MYSNGQYTPDQYSNYYANYWNAPASPSSTSVNSYDNASQYSLSLNDSANYTNWYPTSQAVTTATTAPATTSNSFNSSLYSNYSNSPSVSSTSNSFYDTSYTAPNPSKCSNENSDFYHYNQYSPHFSTEYPVDTPVLHFVQPTNLFPSYQPDLLNSTPAESKKKTLKKSTTVAAKHQSLPDRAVDELNDWFDDHLNNPYPTSEEKERLAMRGGITVKQVNAWFSNRRNRSQNTRPKRIRREFEKEIADIVTELRGDELGQQASYAVKAKVIEKLQRSLQVSNTY